MSSISYKRQSKALAALTLSVHISESLAMMTEHQIADLLMAEVYSQLPSSTPMSYLIEEVAKRLRKQARK